MTNVIEVRSLSKSYRLGNSYLGSADIHKALDNISFDVPEGQRLGIIGKNGAGKSTLLKILSRITSPSSGRAKIIGTMGSLLEVGTGFHAELTGRENVFLNGSILGMSTQQVKSKFDEIVEFSGISKFIDTPIKRYSSGMQTRLAFAVAAFLEPDIMVVDEVLAVGDVEFQERCMKQMENMTSSGRTILFVSHNMASIRRVCNRCMLLDQGQVTEDDEDVDLVVGRYLNNNTELATSWTNIDRDKYSSLTPCSLQLTIDGKRLDRPCFSDEEVILQFKFALSEDVPNLSIGFHLYTGNMEEVLYSYNTDHRDFRGISLKAGEHILNVKVPTNILNINDYVIKLAAGLIADRSLFSAEESKISVAFKVNENLLRSSYWHNNNNIISPLLSWKFHENN